MELKETLDEKDKFFKELQYEIEEYKNDYDSLKTKYDATFINYNNNSSLRLQNDDSVSGDLNIFIQNDKTFKKGNCWSYIHIS